ncbi:hypothetical protein DFR75_1011184 [Nocardia ignorata]|uniref:Uncharacterized protein n=1 Tax=Nocardia ignorata TaxID=145285 RepID=A0A4R6PT88_NOCIG|nr:hypothetical protein DFR75_1011184 [Nocardia ignorata]
MRFGGLVPDYTDLVFAEHAGESHGSSCLPARMSWLILCDCRCLLRRKLVRWLLLAMVSTGFHYFRNE